jgi:hypothetical protein
LRLAFCLACLLALAVVTQGQAGDYYFYEGPKGELVISNKEPPPGTKIIKRLPDVTAREVPQVQEPGKKPPTVQARRLTKALQDQVERVQTHLANHSSKPVADCILGPNLRCLRVGLHVEGKPFRLAASRHHLVHHRHRRLLYRDCRARGIRTESSVRGEGHESRGDCWFLFSVTSREQKA